MSEHHAIFISYRRDDTADVAGRIYDRLVAAFGAAAVFKDVDAIPAGVDFASYIDETLAQCRVVLALIGPGWLDARDAQGRRRLEDPGDFVRLEVERALGMPDVQVIPVVINAARLPTADELPESLRPIPRLNAAQVRRDPDFNRDIERLIQALRSTGHVQAPEPELSVAGRQWAQLRESEDIDDLRRFAAQFPGTEEGFEALRRADMLVQRAEQAAELKARQDADYGSLNKWHPDAIKAFLIRWPDHPKREELQARLADLPRLIQEQEEEVGRREKRARQIKSRRIIAGVLIWVVGILAFILWPMIDSALGDWRYAQQQAAQEARLQALQGVLPETLAGLALEDLHRDGRDNLYIATYAAGEANVKLELGNTYSSVWADQISQRAGLSIAQGIEFFEHAAGLATQACVAEARRCSFRVDLLAGGGDAEVTSDGLTPEQFEAFLAQVDFDAIGAALAE